MKKNLIITAASIGVLILAAAFKNGNSGKEVTIINTVEVKDFVIFKKAFEAGEPIRQKAGISVTGIYQSVDNANMVTVVEGAANAEMAKAFFSDPKAKEAMEKAGVISKPELKILNKIQ